MSGVEGDVAANMARGEAQLREAAGRGAQIALTPEAMLSGYTDRERSAASALAMPGPETVHLAGVCAELGVYLLLGLVALAGEGYTNSVAFLGPEGFSAASARSTSTATRMRSATRAAMASRCGISSSAACRCESA